MKYLVALVLAGLGSAAFAAPCLPKNPGDVRAGITKAGVWAYWWCSPTDYEWRAVPLAAITPALTAGARAYLAGTNPDFVKTPALVPSNSPSLTSLHAAVLLAIKAEKRPAAVAAGKDPP